MARLTSDEKAIIRDMLNEAERDIKICEVDYNKTPGVEAKGWDVKIIKEYGVQVKTRSPKWWSRRGKDFAIETYDGNRPGGLGWFELYKDNGIRYFIFIWRCCEEQVNGKDCPRPYRERKCQSCAVPRVKPYSQMYKNDDDAFFSLIEKLKKKYNYKKFEVDEKGMDGVSRKVGGFILPLISIKELLVEDGIIDTFLKDLDDILLG